jgi:hypothetical protein
MKAAALVLAVLVVMGLLIGLVLSTSPVEPVPTPAPELPALQPTAWNAPSLGPEPNAYDPNRWWQPNNNAPCDPNDPYCPNR